MATTKCAVCKRHTREWMYQPFGPDEQATFSFPGSHYRGFPAIGVCDACKQRIEAGEAVTFAYKGARYITDTDAPSLRPCGHNVTARIYTQECV